MPINTIRQSALSCQRRQSTSALTLLLVLWATTSTIHKDASLVVQAVPLMEGLADPALQALFTEQAPNALDPSYIMTPQGDELNSYVVGMVKSKHHKSGLVNAHGEPVETTIFGYSDDLGDAEPLWPGKTIVQKGFHAGGPETVYVQWENRLNTEHILPVDTNLHWCYSLEGYTDYSIERDGIPVIPHLHGGRSDFEFDGNPEFFFSPGNRIVGPQWDKVPGGFTNYFEYDNLHVNASCLWYHDHALGITRLNVYAGLAGFYIVRGELDTGFEDNPLGLPAGEYELAYVVQDRMFRDDGELFYPAFPGDPTYEDFIVGEGAILPEDLFPGGGPTALAEFFGDFILVNGKIWPKTDVEPREYRLRLLNGADSRYFVVQFVIVANGETTIEDAVGLDYTIIGSDGGLGEPVKMTGPFVFEPGARYDIIIDFAPAKGQRVIMVNVASDAPFGGSFGADNDPADLFEDRRTGRIMAFDVEDTENAEESKLDVGAFPTFTGYPRVSGTKIREVALFEGLDEFGRLQPLLGAKADIPTADKGLFPAYTWSNPTTEFPEVGSTEEWYISNFSADAHPIHLHLVKFEILHDYTFTYTIDEAEDQITEGHMGTLGTAPKITSISEFNFMERDNEYYLHALRDTVVVLPGDPDALTGRGSVIRVTFPKVGRFNWHCHILSHEDHEMMRAMEVVDKAYPDRDDSKDDEEHNEDDDDEEEYPDDGKDSEDASSSSSSADDIYYPDFTCQCDCHHYVQCACQCEYSGRLDPNKHVRRTRTYQHN